MMTLSGQNWHRARLFLLVLIAVLTLGGILMMDPVAQPLKYHDFANEQTLFGIPNFWNVISNLPFLLVGLAGLKFCIDHEKLLARWSWMVLFAAVMMVAFGSTYYHLHPNNSTLVWDRLPMSIGFMGLFVALLTDYADPRSEKLLLIPTVILGISAVAYWAIYDDVRFYAWVQFFPLLSIVLLVVLFKSRYAQNPYLWGSLVLYMLSKKLELSDQDVFSLTGNLMAGHPIKHLLAASAIYLLYIMLKHRKPV